MTHGRAWEDNFLVLDAAWGPVGGMAVGAAEDGDGVAPPPFSPEACPPSEGEEGGVGAPVRESGGCCRMANCGCMDSMSNLGWHSRAIAIAPDIMTASHHDRKSS